MSLVENIIYGFISGIAEFLPVSSRAHQVLIRYLFGSTARDPFQDLLVHIGVILSIFVACREILIRLKRQHRVNTVRKRKIQMMDGKSVYDLRLIKTACIPLLLGLLLSFVTSKLENNLLFLLGFLILNAVILLLAEHSSHGNRDSRTMSALDGIAMGVLGSFSVFPGISRTGIIASYATLRGADSQNATIWAVLLGIPALLFWTFFDLFGMFTFGVSVASFSVILGYILAGAAAFCGGYIGISLLQAVLNRSGFLGFAYYSFGAAIFLFVLYLIT